MKISKNLNFKADKKFKPQFTLVNEDLNFAVQRRNLIFRNFLLPNCVIVFKQVIHEFRKRNIQFIIKHQQ